MPPPSLIRAINMQDQAKKKWEVKINHATIPDASLVEISSHLGTLRYGWTLGNYDGWSFHEVGGGGAVTLPFTVIDGTLVVGVVEQLRHNQGGVVLNAPRGYREPGESRASTATRELSEETGLISLDVVSLGGRPLNPNSAVFETPDPDEGTQAYGVEIPTAWLVPDGARWLVHADRLDNSPGARDERLRELVGRLIFVPWTEAVALADMFTVAAVGRLLAFLDGASRLAVTINGEARSDAPQR